MAAASAGFSIFGLHSFAGASPDHELSSQELKEWFKALHSAGEIISYSPKNNPLAAVPMGGIGCGNVYIGVDGSLRDWLIFNNVNPAQIADTFFAINTRKSGESVTRILQTSSNTQDPVAQPIQDTRLVGEYPFAFLRYLDTALPIEIRMEAFSPMVPLDSHASACPGVVFHFHLKNTSSQPVDASIMMAAQNALCDAAEGRMNYISSRAGLSSLCLGIQPGTPAKMSFPNRLVTTARDFDLPVQEKPENIEIVLTKSPQITKDDLMIKTPSRNLIWLDNPSPIDIATAQALHTAVSCGAVLLLSGASGFLNAACAAEGKESLSEGDIIFENFESGTYADWALEGDAFGEKPQTGTLANQNPVSGWQGKHFVNSFIDGDKSQGKLVSKPFTISRRYIRFLIGGGPHGGRTCMNLVVAGKITRSQTGRADERLAPAEWHVEEFMGQEAHLEIIDAESGPWGHINIDQIIFTASPLDPFHPGAALEIKNLVPAVFKFISQNDDKASVQADTLPGLSQPLTLAGTETMQAMELLEGASVVLKTRKGLPLLIKRVVGKGCVYLLLARLAREGTEGCRRALRLIAALAGGTYTPPRGAHPDDPGFGEMCLATDCGETTAIVSSRDSGKLLRSLHVKGRLNKIQSSEKVRPTKAEDVLNGALASSITIPPGKEALISFYLTWRFPNYYFQGKLIGNRYAAKWPDAGATAASLSRNRKKLHAATELFRKTIYDTTLPYWLIDCLTSQASTIRSEVCVWTGEDAFAGFEGAGGCCPMNCSHVWGYEQTLSRLYPDLERRMRLADLKHQQNPDGGLNNRIALPLASRPTGEHPFADGHASGILKAYREHLNSSDNKFLKEYYPNIKKAVDYLLLLDGQEPDGIIEGEQWNTYDCQISGPNSFIGTYYLAALRAGEEMAKLIGDNQSAKKWRAVFESGQKRLVELTWNGEYFYQNYPDYQESVTQYGPGCLADQLIGQWWAHQLGLGYLLPCNYVRKALKRVFNYNWLQDFSKWSHNQRVFADGHDKGLLCCTWPRGGRPGSPILYCDEAWTGVEYQVAAHMIYEGLLEEGLAIAGGARERYDGRKRNPWNEIECGGHYARAMSSWSLLTALSGFSYDGPKGVITFNPVFKPDNFKSLFTSAEGWGSFSQTRDSGSQENKIQIAWGKLKLRELHLSLPAGMKLINGLITLNGRRCGRISSRGRKVLVHLANETIARGAVLAVRLSLAGNVPEP